MPWFYAKSGQQAGPIDEPELERLVSEGAIGPTTLVWCEGMANWQPLAQVRPTALPPAIPLQEPISPPSDQVICSECHKPFSAGETVQIGSAIICAACKPTYVQKLREGTVAFHAQVSATRYASFWIRAGAYLIDYLILTIVELPMSLWFAVRVQQSLQGGFDWASYFGNLGVSSAISTIVVIGYSWFFVGRYGATPGKMFVRIKVVTADGGNVSYTRALGRSAASIVSGFICMIGYVIAAFDDEKRTLHDRMCNTRVVYK